MKDFISSLKSLQGERSHLGKYFFMGIAALKKAKKDTFVEEQGFLQMLLSLWENNVYEYFVYWLYKKCIDFIIYVYI